MNRMMGGVALCLLAFTVAGCTATLVSAQADPAGASPEVAVTRGFNVYFLPAKGGHLQAVTTRGNGYAGVYYPWYQWSPDGRYLLLVRATGSSWTILLLNSRGSVLRTLATGPGPADFYPSWALDRDEIVYVAAQHIAKAQGGLLNDVARLDLDGRRTLMWRYISHEGCGGGTPDPAMRDYWEEVGFEGRAPTMQWDPVRHLAIYSASCTGGLNFTNTETRHTRYQPASHRSSPIGPWSEAALSSTGQLAATYAGGSVTGLSAANAGGTGTSRLALANPRSGAILRTIGAGELPAWSPDGRTLFFVRRTPGRVLTTRDTLGNTVALQTYYSAIWQADSGGTHLRRLTLQNRFAFGPLNVAPGGHALIYSAIDNDWALWRHRQPGGRFSAALLQKYAPAIAVQRLDVGAAPTVVASNAGRPEIQPR